MHSFLFVFVGTFLLFYSKCTKIPQLEFLSLSAFVYHQTDHLSFFCVTMPVCMCVRGICLATKPKKSRVSVVYKLYLKPVVFYWLPTSATTNDDTRRISLSAFLFSFVFSGVFLSLRRTALRNATQRVASFYFVLFWPRVVLALLLLFFLFKLYSCIYKMLFKA